MPIKSYIFSVSLILNHHLTGNNHAFYYYPNTFPQQLGHLPPHLLLLTHIFYHLEYFGSFQHEIIIRPCPFLELTFDLHPQISERLLHILVLDIESLIYIGGLQVQGLVKDLKLRLNEIHILIYLLCQLLHGLFYLRLD